MIRRVGSLIAVLAAWPTGALSAMAQGATVFGAYVNGIRIGELSIRGTGASRTYTIRKKDMASNRWSQPTTAREAAVAGDSAFALWGSLRRLPGLMPELRSGGASWASFKAVGWPDTATIYIRHRELKESVGGRSVTAWHWAQKDGSRPMDLVLGATGELIAGIDPTGDYVLVRRGYERFTNVARWNDPKISPARYGYRALGKTMVKMSDGVGLTTLVYLPDGAGDGPFPTVFIRTPYGIGDLIGRMSQYPARGYAFVAQSTRGQSFLEPANRSEGTFDMLINEPKDGGEALEWIVRQPWSDGKVCMQGGSYVGYTQWSVTMARNPALKCVVPESSMGTVFADQPYMGGGFLVGFAYALFWMLEKPILPERNWTEILHHRPLADIDRFATGQDLPQWNVFFDHPTNDDYWRRKDWYRGDHARDVAALMFSGWFDDDFPGTESNWALLARRGTQPSRIVIGPWKHGFNIDRSLNGYPFGPDALRDDVWLLKQLWYDRFLKGIDNGVDRTVAEYFVMGENRWRTASAWPPKEAQDQAWYFHSDGQASRFLTAGQLTTTPPTAPEPPDRYQYDPRNPVPNWISFEQLTRWADVQTFPYDFKDIEARQDVVVFTTPPLEADLTIAGNVRVELYASTDVLDTDWWVHVSDVNPNGQSNRLGTTALRARFRKLEDPRYHIFGSNYQTEELLSGDPKDVVRYEISIHALANTFRKGHRVRIAVMNALDNYLFPNSNTGKNEGLVTETVVGNMAVHHTPEYPSRVWLPVMP